MHLTTDGTQYQKGIGAPCIAQNKIFIRRMQPGMTERIQQSATESQ